jgi:hypothetical protein
MVSSIKNWSNNRCHQLSHFVVQKAVGLKPTRVILDLLIGIGDLLDHPHKRGSIVSGGQFDTSPSALLAPRYNAKLFR